MCSNHQSRIYSKNEKWMTYIYLGLHTDSCVEIAYSSHRAAELQRVSWCRAIWNNETLTLTIMKLSFIRLITKFWTVCCWHILWIMIWCTKNKACLHSLRHESQQPRRKISGHIHSSKHLTEQHLTMDQTCLIIQLNT